MVRVEHPKRRAACESPAKTVAMAKESHFILARGCFKSRVHTCVALTDSKESSPRKTRVSKTEGMGPNTGSRGPQVSCMGTEAIPMKVPILYPRDNRENPSQHCYYKPLVLILPIRTAPLFTPVGFYDRLNVEPANLNTLEWEVRLRSKGGPYNGDGKHDDTDSRKGPTP
jgi:hypothetical protein